MKNGLLVMLITIVFLYIGNTKVSLDQEEKRAEIDAPNEVVYQKEEWNNNSALIASYLLPEELYAMVNKSRVELQEEYGFQRCTAYLIFDWSIDSDKEWHYDSSWDCGEEIKAPLYSIVNKNVINEAEVFWLTYRQQWDCFLECIQHHGKQKETTFDYKKHTLYIRSKYVVRLTSPEKKAEWISSEWTSAVKIGKDYSVKLGDAEKETIEVSNAVVEMGKTGVDPFLTFECHNSKELCEELLKVRALCKEDYRLEAQIRYNGGDWEEAHVVNGTSPYLYSKRMVQLPEGYVTDPKGVQLRVRYHYDGNDERGVGESVTLWSEPITVGENCWWKENEAETAIMKEQSERHYSICLSILLVLLTVIMLVLVLVKPKNENKEKENIEEKKNGSNSMYRDEKKRKTICRKKSGKRKD